MRGIEVRIVFLDFDGPIIPIMSHTNHRVSGKGTQAWSACVLALNRITETTGARIVVSSTWRWDGFEKTNERLKDWGVTGKPIRNPIIYGEKK